MTENVNMELTPVYNSLAGSETTEVVVVLNVGSGDGCWDPELTGRLAVRGASEALRSAGVASVSHAGFEVRRVADADARLL